MLSIQFELKHLRKQYGLSQAHVADLLGVNQTTVARWETGQLPLTQRRRYELFDIFMNKRGRIDRVVEKLVIGHRYVSVFDADNRFIHTSEQLATVARQNRADIIGRSNREFDDSSWCDEIYGDIPVQERLLVEFAFDLRRKDAPADQAICRLECKESWLQFGGSSGLCVMFADVLPATGEGPRLLNQVNTFNSGREFAN